MSPTLVPERERLLRAPFARDGYAVGLLSRRAESSKPVAEEIFHAAGKALAVPADVTDHKAYWRQSRIFEDSGTDHYLGLSETLIFL